MSPTRQAPAPRPRRALALSLVSGLLSVPPGGSAGGPAWWIERGAVDPGRPTDHYAVVNQGQLKHMVVSAYEEFHEKWPDPANANILARIDAFPPGGDYRPANLGMLKHAAQPFYDRLIAAGYVAGHPWAGGKPADFALANQGQLKNLFSFDLDAYDTGGTGAPDWWTRMYGTARFDGGGRPIGAADAYAAWLADRNPDRGAENRPVGGGAVHPPSGLVPGDAVALDGSAAAVVSGTWMKDGSALRAVSRRGQVKFAVNLAHPDIYRIRLTVSQSGVPSGAQQPCPLRISVNGEFLARPRPALANGETARIDVQTQFLSAGVHDVEILWDNPRNGLSLRIEDIRLQRWLGPDTNGNGIQDWVENRLIRRNAIDRAPRESRTSPVCVEGLGRFAARVAGVGPVSPGPGDRWYADVPLLADGSPTPVSVDFENGGRVLTRTIRWKPTNLLTDPLVRLAIRKGDALRLTAALPGMRSGTAEIRVNGSVVGTCAIDGAVVYRFERAGDYTLEGVCSGLDAAGAPVAGSRSVTVRVLALEPVVLAAQVNQPRAWRRPENWPAEAVVEWDNRLQWPVIDGQPRLQHTSVEPRHGVVRLGPDGPVLAPVTVKGFNLWVMRNTDLFYETIHPDGSFRAKTTMIMSPAHPEVRVNQRCRGPVAYLDGSRVRDFAAADFDTLGEVVVVFVHSSPRAHSVCHFTDTYQDDVHLGRAY